MTTGIDIPVKVTEASEAIALLNRIATAVEGTGRAADEAEEKTSSLGDAFNSLGEKARNFNEIRESVMSLASGLLEAATRVAELASEQQALDANSVRLNLNFQQAAQQAGGFVSELQAMTLATSMANRGINLTQTELDALARIGMQRARDTGKSLDEVFDQLGESIIEGGEELTKFGTNLGAVAGETGNAAQRIEILVNNARQMPPAMRTASDEVENFKNQLLGAARTMATSFTQELQHLSDIGAPFRDGTQDVEEFNRSLRAVGQTAAHVAMVVGNVLAILGAGIAQALVAIRGALQRGLAAITFSEQESREEAYGSVEGLTAFIQRRAASLRAIMAENEQRTRPQAPTAPPQAAEPPVIEITGTVGRQRQRDGQRARPLADMAITAESLAEEERARMRALAASDAAFMERRRITDQHLRELAELRDAVAQRDRERAERAFEQSDAGVRFQVETERVAERERRTLEHRRENMRRFTDFLEDQYSRQIVVAREAADTMTMSVRSLTSAYADNLVAWADGTKTFEEAGKAMLAMTLENIAKEAAQKSALNIAEGIAALAMGNVGSAGLHFAAATAYGVLAGGAGYAAGQMKESASTSKASNEDQAARSATPMGGGGGGGRGDTIINVAFNGPQFGTGGVVQAAREVVGVINRGAIQGAVQLNAAAVGRLR